MDTFRAQTTAPSFVLSEKARWNLSTAALCEAAIRRGEGLLAESGALVVNTAPHTGRSPRDKFIVDEPSSRHLVWWGKINRPIAPEHFDALLAQTEAYLRAREVFVQDCFVGADPRYRLPLRVVTEFAWHNLFARSLFIPAQPRSPADFEPALTVIAAPGVHADPATHRTHSEVFILLDLSKKMALIGGTKYAGEIKKAVFTLMNYLLPFQDVLPMHCAANVGAGGDVALFFGLSGTGKTTLSTDPNRRLIGDDEHGWSDAGIFNFEGGCYAKVIRLSATAEPQIYAAVNRFGAVLENVTIHPHTRALDFDDDALTENTRGAYPIAFIPNADLSGMAGHPRNVVFLAADAFGVLPPIARLSYDQAQYYFLSGYTAKVAGTERGITNPVATFSPCFGAPFMVRPPTVYAEMLDRRLRRHRVNVWLINTGWNGQGKRMPLAWTRAMLNAALSGALDEVSYRTDPIFGLAVPLRCPGVPDSALDPTTSWSSEEAYQAQARRLAAMFAENFAEFAAAVPEAVRAAGPRAST